MLTLGCCYAAVGILFILGIHYLELTGDPDGRAARWLDSVGSALSSRRVKLAVLGVFFATLLVALVKPVPLLERSGLPITHRVFSARVDQHAVYDAGGFGVGFAEEYGCLEIRNALGTTVVCNRDLHCSELSWDCGGSHCKKVQPRYWDIEIYRAEVDVYSVSVSSACNSVCCDSRGTTLNSRGERRDDRWFLRPLVRLEGLGSAACLVGLVGLLLGPRGLLSGIAFVSGFVTTIAMLWWNL